MKKIIALIFLTLFLFSCENVKQEKEIVKEKTKQEINIPEEIKNTEIVEEIEKTILEVEKKIPYYKTNGLITKKWKKEKIGKLICKSGAFNLKDSEEKIVKFIESNETKILQKKVDEFNKRKDIIGGFSYFVSEYCKNKENNKYIFWTQDKPIFVFGRYDKDLDIVEPAEFKYKTFDYIGGSRYIRGYNIKLEKYYLDYLKKNNFNGFGKRIGNKIKIRDFARPIADTYKELKDFLKEKNSKYCYNGLTPKGNKAICFADVYYSYDFVKNILTEDKNCTYYIDDNGKIQTLESCKEFKY